MKVSPFEICSRVDCIANKPSIFICERFGMFCGQHWDEKIIDTKDLKFLEEMGRRFRYSCINYKEFNLKEFEEIIIEERLKNK